MWTQAFEAAEAERKAAEAAVDASMSAVLGLVAMDRLVEEMMALHGV